MKPFRIVKGLAVAVLCVSIIGIGVQQLEYYQAGKRHDQAKELTGFHRLESVTEAVKPEPELESPESAETETKPPETVETETRVPETEIETESDSPETETETETKLPETEVETEAKPPETEVLPTETETEPEQVEVDDYAAQLLTLDLAPLKEKNSDVFGWIVIPGTTISYPLVQGTDNEHYLFYTWDALWSWSGSIFLDYRSSQSMTDFHTIIYGHRMYNDTMFNGLKNYEDPEFAEENPSVYILTADGVRRYDVFAAYEADVENGHSYRLGLEGAKDQQTLINYCRKRSVIAPKRKVSAEDGDRMLTLSTCTAVGTSESRWVVHFVLAYEHILSNK